MDVVARSAEELIKHTKGPGTRFVFSDHKNNPEGNIYVIMREVHDVDPPEMHIEAHVHDYESLFIFKGSNPDMTGLEVEVLLGETWHDPVAEIHQNPPWSESQLSLHQRLR